MKQKTLTSAVLTALGLTPEARRAAREAVTLTRDYARAHGWRATLAAFIAPEGNGHE